MEENFGGRGSRLFREFKASTHSLVLFLTFFFPFPLSASSVSMVQLSSSPFGYQSPSGHSEEGKQRTMKSAKPQVNHSQHGESQRAMSPLQSALSSAASPSQAYETYIDNGLICLKHKIRNIEKKKVTFFPHPALYIHHVKLELRNLHFYFLSGLIGILPKDFFPEDLSNLEI